MNIILIVGLILLAISIILLVIGCFDTIIDSEASIFIGIIIFWISLCFIVEGEKIEHLETESNFIQQIIIKK